MENWPLQSNNWNLFAIKKLYFKNPTRLLLNKKQLVNNNNNNDIKKPLNIQNIFFAPSKIQKQNMRKYFIVK